MATAREVVTDALRLLAVYSAGETPSSSDMTDGVSSLNDMLAAWNIDGVPLNHETLTVDAEMVVPDDHLKAIKNNLAVDLAGQFGAAVPQRVAMDADNGLSLLRALYLDLDPLRIDRALEPRRWWYLGGLRSL